MVRSWRDKCPQKTPVRFHISKHGVAIVEGAGHARLNRCGAAVTTFPTLIRSLNSGAANHLQKAHSATSGHSGRGQAIAGAAAMAVSSSIDTGTPAPAVRLPLDPLPTHRNGTPSSVLRRNRARDLTFTRGRHRRGNWLPSNSLVCRRRSPRPGSVPRGANAAGGGAQARRMRGCGRGGL